MLLAESMTKCRIRGYSGRTEYSLFILLVLHGGEAMDNSKKNIVQGLMKKSDFVKGRENWQELTQKYCSTSWGIHG